jgi:hypothetical protein
VEQLRLANKAPTASNTWVKREIPKVVYAPLAVLIGNGDPGFSPWPEEWPRYTLGQFRQAYTEVGINHPSFDLPPFLFDAEQTYSLLAQAHERFLHGANEGTRREAQLVSLTMWIQYLKLTIPTTQLHLLDAIDALLGDLSDTFGPKGNHHSHKAVDLKARCLVAASIIKTHLKQCGVKEARDEADKIVVKHVKGIAHQFGVKLGKAREESRAWKTMESWRKDLRRDSKRNGPRWRSRLCFCVSRLQQEVDVEFRLGATTEHVVRLLFEPVMREKASAIVLPKKTDI